MQYYYLKLKIVAWLTLEVIKYYYQLLTPVWMNVEYSRILAIEDVQRVLSSTTVRMVAKYLRIPETSWEERRMGWIGLRNPPEWFWRVDSFHSCWATRFAIELVEAWDLLGCWDTLIINWLCCLPSDIQPECSPDNMLVIDEISPEWYHLVV